MRTEQDLIAYRRWERRRARHCESCAALRQVIGVAANLGISFGGLIDEFSIYNRALSTKRNSSHLSRRVRRQMCNALDAR